MVGVISQRRAAVSRQSGPATLMPANTGHWGANPGVATALDPLVLLGQAVGRGLIPDLDRSSVGALRSSSTVDLSLLSQIGNCVGGSTNGIVTTARVGLASRARRDLCVAFSGSSLR